MSLKLAMLILERATRCYADTGSADALMRALELIDIMRDGLTRVEEQMLDLELVAYEQQKEA